MTRPATCLAATCLLLASFAGSGHADGEFTPPGPNVALGKSYTMDPAPDHDRWQYLWARTTKAAVPEFVILCDPSNATPQTTGVREMYESADILCPYRQHYVDGGKVVQDFYEELRAGGRTLFMYAIGSGPARSPISNMRAQSWLVWQMKGKGSLYWAYGDTERYGRPGTERYQNMGTWDTLAPTVELYSPGLP